MSLSFPVDAAASFDLEKWRRRSFKSSSSCKSASALDDDLLFEDSSMLLFSNDDFGVCLKKWLFGTVDGINGQLYFFLRKSDFGFETGFSWRLDDFELVNLNIR